MGISFVSTLIWCWLYFSFMYDSRLLDLTYSSCDICHLTPHDSRRGRLTPYYFCLEILSLSKKLCNIWFLFLLKDFFLLWGLVYRNDLVLFLSSYIICFNLLVSKFYGHFEEKTCVISCVLNRKQQIYRQIW